MAADEVNRYAGSMTEPLLKRSPELMSRGDTALLVVDVQEKLMPLISTARDDYLEYSTPARCGSRTRAVCGGDGTVSPGVGFNRVAVSQPTRKNI